MSVNKEHIQISIDAVKEFKEFDMNNRDQCVMGVCDKDVPGLIEYWGCSTKDANNICWDWNGTFYHGLYLSQVTKDMAIRALEYLRDNGTTKGWRYET